MFDTPIFIPRNLLDPAIYGAKPANQTRTPFAPRLSVASSTTSSVGLHRTSSNSSTNSVSTNASSIASIDVEQRPQHRKTFSSSSLRIPRRLLRKSRPEEPRRPTEPAPRSTPQVTSAPVVPPKPIEAPALKSATEWQCSDLVVRCKSDVYHVDRVIMCYHSRWFARVCAVIMPPKSSKSVIDLSADGPSAVAAMMQYCYQLDYTDQLTGSDASVPEDATLRSHVDVYMLAERYGIDGLKQLALQKFEEFGTMVLMVEGNEEQLLQAIRAIYASGRKADADELRQLAVKLCADHVQAFLHGTGKTMAMVYESMDKLPDFRADLFEEMGSRWK